MTVTPTIPKVISPPQKASRIIRVSIRTKICQKLKLKGEKLMVKPSPQKSLRPTISVERYGAGGWW